MTRKIAIQGIKGSFHHQVASEYYDSSVSLVECSTFDALVQAVLAGDCDQAVMAIENSIAGSILPNYALLDQNELVIVGEFYLSIQHNLMGLPGQSITDIEEVHSHPMALLQCKKFFRDYPFIKLVERIFEKWIQLNTISILPMFLIYPILALTCWGKL